MLGCWFSLLLLLGSFAYAYVAKRLSLLLHYLSAAFPAGVVHYCAVDAILFTLSLITLMEIELWHSVVCPNWAL